MSTAVAIFQRFMDICWLESQECSLTLMTSSLRAPDEHVSRLQAMLRQLAEAGLWLQKEECMFATTEVEFLAFRVDKDEVHPPMEKVEVNRNAHTPKTKTELQASLELLNFYICMLEGKTMFWNPCADCWTTMHPGAGLLSMIRYTNRQRSCFRLKMCWSSMMKRSLWCWFVMPLLIGLELC